MSVSAPAGKPALRAAAKAARDAIADRAPREAAIVARLLALPSLTRTAVVGAYWPLGSEVDPRPALHELAARGVRLALPRVVQRGAPLAFLAWSPGEALEPGPLGTTQPAATAEPLVPQALIVPLLGFDRRRFRLGYGGGFYDRSLALLRAHGPLLAIGVGFAAQELEAVPDEPFDQPMDLIVTEDRLLGG